MTPYKVLYARKCCTPLCWVELGKSCVLGPELVSKIENTVKLIRNYLKAAFDRQKLYTDLKKCDIKYSVGDQVFLKVSSWKKLELPPELDQIHDVLHVSMLRWYQSDPFHIVPIKEIEVLKRKIVPFVKVLWQNHGSKEAMWEPEDSICQQYPHRVCVKVFDTLG
ncbi:reverse transcriptase [Gossypium australe]|uniref:Reverse transcriptase n=1 Tax=Gossypium australe TaxID=47621 RepID=A0A5B6VM30_9ROSI|nr:reverse transcriptase [Gossypium australe]